MMGGFTFSGNHKPLERKPPPQEFPKETIELADGRWAIKIYTTHVSINPDISRDHVAVAILKLYNDLT